MKSPLDYIEGTITSYDERTGKLKIEAEYNDWVTMIRREYKDVYIQLRDSRPLSDKQRKMCYALLREISNFTGMGADPTKQYMKLKFMVEELEETGDRLFSLANAPMSLVCSFQRFLIRFILDWDIPCSFPLLDYVDDVQDYIYACLTAKKCAVCGARADLHHVDHVGTGRDRNEILHEGMKALPLCREHHTECHTIGHESFKNKYHLTDGVELDKTLCRIYHLKRRKENDRD